MEFYEKCLAIQLKTLGSEHPSVATTYNNIGSVMDNQGEYEKALEYYEKSLELESLINAGILNTNLESEAGLQNLLEEHLKVGSRMPSESERTMVLSYIKQSFKIIIIEIILGAKTGDVNNVDKTLDKIYKYVYKKHRVKSISQQSLDLILLKTLKDDIKIADIINKIKYRIFEKLHNISKNNRESNSRFNYSVFINDMRHYQVLKINKKIINNYREVSDFLSPKNNFTFSQKSIRSSSNK